MQTIMPSILQKEITAAYCRLTKQEEYFLIKRAHEGCIKSRNMLVESQLPAIKLIANFYVKTNPRTEIADLINVGTIGLIESIGSFDPSTGFRLFSYAQRFIGNAIRDFSVDDQLVRNTRSRSKSRKLQPGEEALYHPDEIEFVKGEWRLKAEIFQCTSLDSPMNPDDASGTTIHDILADENSLFDEHFISSDCAKVLRFLSPENRLFIERHFGLNGHPETSLAQLGKECMPEVSRQTMSIRLGKVLDELNQMVALSL